jgi:hypothetical protein
MIDEGQQQQPDSDYYRIKAQIMHRQAKRAAGGELRSLYEAIAEEWESKAEEKLESDSCATMN